MINILETIMQRKATINHQNESKGDMKSTWANITKAKQLLNWQSEVSFEKTLKASVKWYLANKKWLESMPC